MLGHHPSPLIHPLNPCTPYSPNHGMSHIVIQTMEFSIEITISFIENREQRSRTLCSGCIQFRGQTLCVRCPWIWVETPKSSSLWIIRMCQGYLSFTTPHHPQRTLWNMGTVIAERADCRRTVGSSTSFGIGDWEYSETIVVYHSSRTPILDQITTENARDWTEKENFVE